MRLLLSLLSVAMAFNALPPVFVPCTPPLTFPSCEDCNASHLAEALRTCAIPRQGPLCLHTDAVSGQPRVICEPGLNRGRLGNHLGHYFNALALAELTGLPLASTPYVYDGFSLRPPAPLTHARRRLGRVPELQHYCERCPLSLEYPTLCDGMWTAYSNMRPHLQEAFRRIDQSPLPPQLDVVIQFRCSDSHSNYRMGLLPFGYYHKALAGRVNSSSHITIIPDPGVPEHGCCQAMVHVLSNSLYHTFHCSVEVRWPSTVARDLALMAHARIFVGSASTFGLFAAIGTFGEAVLPVSRTLMGLRTPCFRGVRWIRVQAEEEGCNRAVSDWFVDRTRMPSLYRQLKSAFQGDWFPPAALPTAEPSAVAPPDPSGSSALGRRPGPFARWAAQVIVNQHHRRPRDKEPH
eukprot:EG_transcript_7783